MSDLNILMAIGIATMLVMALGVIFFVVLYQRRMLYHQLELKILNEQKQLELVQASVKGEEDERMRIASELHDDVGATLSSVRLFVQQVVKDPKDEEVANKTKELLDVSIQKIREISHQLQPSSLQYLGLSKVLQSLVEVYQKAGSVKVSFKEEADWIVANQQINLSIYRIIQELITNTLKHAAAKSIKITKCVVNNAPCISIWHNGDGLTNDGYREMIYKKHAIGLKNIENRLKSSMLSINFTQVNDGYYIDILIPQE